MEALRLLLGVSWAIGQGAKPGGGLGQAQILAASERLLKALADADGAGRAFRPDLMDVIAAAGEPGSAERRLASSRFIDVTRGVTAQVGIREAWRSFYAAALTLDEQGTLIALRVTDPARTELLRAAEADPQTLRRHHVPISRTLAAMEILFPGSAAPEAWKHVW